MNSNIHESMGKYVFKKTILNKQFIYFSRNTNELKFLKKNLNETNPELFNLNFIHQKFNILNYQIIDNILQQQ